MQGAGLSRISTALLSRLPDLSRGLLVRKQRRDVHGGRAAKEEKETLRTSVAIVGGGPSGLTLSILLSKFGVNNVVVEKSETVSEHPQAHFINTRTMEIFRQLGTLEDDVQNLSPPLREWRNFRYCESVLGHMFGKIDHFDEYAESSDRLSPTRVAHLSQNRLLPLLLKELGTACPNSTLIMGENFVDLRQNSRSVEIDTINRQGQKKAILADYLVGADGAHSRVREIAGMKMEGVACLQSIMNIHFTSKSLSKALQGREAMLYFVYNPHVVGVIVSHNMEHGDFVAQIPFFPPVEKVSKYTKEYCLNLLWKAIGENLDLNIRNIKPWTMSALVANHFSTGRTFLAGDSAHLFPPAGGFGMNTGVQDAHNLAWKLAYVLNGSASSSLLHTYSEERRRIAIKNTCLSLANFEETVKVARTFGLDPQLANGVVSAISAVNQLPSFQQPVEKFANSILALGRSQTSPWSPFRPMQQLYLNSLLTQERSLRLLYPEEDIGFCYSEPEILWNGEDLPNWKKSQRSSFSPAVQVGSRFPNTILTFQDPCRNRGTCSSIDLIGDNSHCFLLLLTNARKAADLQKAMLEVQQACDYAITTVFLNCQADELAESWNGKDLFMDADLSQLLFECKGSASDAVVIRPDGHVAEILDLSDGCSSEYLKGKFRSLGLKPRIRHQGDA